MSVLRGPQFKHTTRKPPLYILRAELADDALFSSLVFPIFFFNGFLVS